MKRIGESAKWADFTIRLVAKANSMRIEYNIIAAVIPRDRSTCSAPGMTTYTIRLVAKANSMRIEYNIIAAVIPRDRSTCSAPGMTTYCDQYLFRDWSQSRVFNPLSTT